MQRKALRATVGATDVDIPIHTFLDGQCLVYDAGAITTQVRVRVVGTPTAGNFATWFNSETIQDSGVLAANLVQQPTLSVAGDIPKYADTTGKILSDSGKLAADLVTGPASSVNDRVASFNGATGKIIRDSGISATELVTSTNVGAANKVAVYTGANRILQSVAVAISGGAISSVTTINSRNVDDFVTGPASATDSNIAGFSGTSGKQIYDTGVQIRSDWVRGPVSATDAHVAAFNGSSGKVILDSGILYTDLVLGPSSAVNNRVAAFNGITGKLIKDSGIATADVVFSSASSVTNADIVIFSGTGGRNVTQSGIASGQLVTYPGLSAPANHRVLTFTGGSQNAVQMETVTISGGAIASVATINTIDPSTWVVGPASATSNNLASYNGATGKLIKDSGILATDVVTGPASSTSGNLPSFNGTGGKVLQDSGTAASLVTSHETRHLPGGADSMFSGTWGSNDVVRWNGASLSPKMYYSTKTTAALSVTSLTSPPGANLTMPARSGDFLIEWQTPIQLLDTSGNLEINAAWSSGTGILYVTIIGQTAVNSSSGVSVLYNTASAPQYLLVYCMLVVSGASASLAVTLTFGKSTGAAINILNYGFARATELGV